MKPHFAINLAIIIKLTKNQIFNLHEHFFAEIEFSALNLTYEDFFHNQKTEHIYAIKNLFFLSELLKKLLFVSRMARKLFKITKNAQKRQILCLKATFRRIN